MTQGESSAMVRLAAQIEAHAQFGRWSQRVTLSAVGGYFLLMAARAAGFHSVAFTDVVLGALCGMVLGSSALALLSALRRRKLAVQLSRQSAEHLVHESLNSKAQP